MAKATRYLSLKIGMKIINKNVLLCFLWFLLVFLNGESNKSLNSEKTLRLSDFAFEKFAFAI